MSDERKPKWVDLMGIDPTYPDPQRVPKCWGWDDTDLAAHDAATREAVLVEVAEWLESFGHYDNIAEQVRTLPPHTPQIVPETGLGA